MTSNPPENTQELLEFALELAHAAGERILPHFRQGTHVDNKQAGGFDPVTQGDRDGEQIMRQMIEARFPDHGIIGEEFGTKDAASPLEWILDPIDGTRSFIFGLPTWTTLIGLLHEGTPVLGVMHQPFVGESFYGNGNEAWWQYGKQRRALAVSPAATLDMALISTTAPALYKSDRDRTFLDRLIASSRAIRYDADAYFFCLVASGQMDIALDAGLQSYDIAPLVPIIEGAGGIVSTWEGTPAADGGNIIAAASRQLYEDALALLPS